MKTKNIIQRLCLFLFVLVLAAPAWAEDYERNYNCADYEIFRSRQAVEWIGKNKRVETLRLENGKVEL